MTCPLSVTYLMYSLLLLFNLPFAVTWLDTKQSLSVQRWKPPKSKWYTIRFLFVITGETNRVC